jgi:hypothetical protein
LTAALFFAFLAIQGLRDPAWIEGVLEWWLEKAGTRRLITGLAGFSLAVGWLGAFLPFYRAGILGVHWERIRPAMLFLLLAGFATLAFVLLKRSNFPLPDLKRSSIYKAGLPLFLPSILGIGLMLSTGFGVYAPEDYWYGAGVPILFTQLTAAILGGILFFWVGKDGSGKQFDWIVFLLIYGVTAILWAREPLQESFLFIGPYAPNRDLYPFADAALF